MSSTSRQSVREQFATRVASAMVPSLLVAVYAFKVKKLDGMTPVMAISSAGTLRARRFVGTTTPAGEVYLQAEVFALWSLEESGYTEHDAENAIDTLEAAFADVIAGMTPASVGWTCEYDGRSAVDNVEMDDGTVYRREVIPVKVKLHNG